MKSRKSFKFFAPLAFVFAVLSFAFIFLSKPESASASSLSSDFSISSENRIINSAKENSEEKGFEMQSFSVFKFVSNFLPFGKSE